MIYRTLLIFLIISCIQPSIVIGDECGDLIKPLSFYNTISTYALILCFALFFIGILIDRKIIKISALSLSILPLLVWGYVQFMIDFSEIKKDVYA